MLRNTTTGDAPGNAMTGGGKGSKLAKDFVFPDQA